MEWKRGAASHLAKYTRLFTVLASIAGFGHTFYCLWHMAGWDIGSRIAKDHLSFAIPWQWSSSSSSCLSPSASSAADRISCGHSSSRTPLRLLLGAVWSVESDPNMTRALKTFFLLLVAPFRWMLRITWKWPEGSIVARMDHMLSNVLPDEFFSAVSHLIFLAVVLLVVLHGQETIAAAISLRQELNRTRAKRMHTPRRVMAIPMKSKMFTPPYPTLRMDHAAHMV
ncbi:hypothetical protein L596_023074 [Steinernema carpocapsae]|uniref:Uncharacterized protein n=1 Tax=Steinernema carpocapsae TaxID=34508 RepID=A0A4U5MCK2_STECR|nr:hypothetical protein L596_023074 [Steinernema carpocapsae]